MYFKNYYQNCPTYDLSCPYCMASGECIMEHPEFECDDFMSCLENVEEEEKEEE